MSHITAFGSLFPISLRKHLPHASFVGCGDIWVQHITQDSRCCTEGSLFAAIPGSRDHGLKYLQQAIEQNAGAVLVEHPQCDVPLPQCVVPNVRKAFAELSAALHGHPSQKLSLLGITGTNGKTTVSWLLRSILEAAGQKTGLLGTIENSSGSLSEISSLTTPDAHQFQQWIARMVQEECQYAVTELSSHGLHQQRTAGSLYKAVGITNVTQDHLDYHETYENYLAAKSQIIQLCDRQGTVVVNLDDSGSKHLSNKIYPGQKLFTISQTHTSATLYGEVIDQAINRTRFLMHYGEEVLPVEVSLIGEHNVSNCLMAAGLAFACGIEAEAVIKGLQQLESIPGRLQQVSNERGIQAFVDYAHTDDALKRVLSVLKPLTKGRLICLFGAGGDRDQSKRPLMGKAVSQADLAVVTSDNPRTEEPESIIQQISAGIDQTKTKVHAITDRRAAIEWAVQEAEPSDTILVAGKGHEKIQIIGEERIPFDDVAVLSEFLTRNTSPNKPYFEQITNQSISHQLPEQHPSSL